MQDLPDVDDLDEFGCCRISTVVRVSGAPYHRRLAFEVALNDIEFQTPVLSPDGMTEDKKLEGEAIVMPVGALKIDFDVFCCYPDKVTKLHCLSVVRCVWLF